MIEANFEEEFSTYFIVKKTLHPCGPVLQHTTNFFAVNYYDPAKIGTILMPDLEHFDIITADNFTPLDLSVLGSANDMIHNSVNLIVHKVTEERVIFVQVLKGS